MPLPRDVQQLKPFQLQEGFAPSDPHQGLCPWTPLGALPPDPRYRLALRARHGLQPPKLKILATSLVLVLICAVLTARLCSYNLQQCDATPWIRCRGISSAGSMFGREKDWDKGGKGKGQGEQKGKEQEVKGKRMGGT